MRFRQYTMLNKNPIIKGTIILTIASLLSRIIGFLYRIFLSNLIGAKGMGVFQLIFPVLVFCIALSCGGVQIAVSRFVAESKSRKECFHEIFPFVGSSYWKTAASLQPERGPEGDSWSGDRVCQTAASGRDLNCRGCV